MHVKYQGKLSDDTLARIHNAYAIAIGLELDTRLDLGLLDTAYTGIYMYP